MRARPLAVLCHMMNSTNVPKSKPVPKARAAKIAAVVEDPKKMEEIRTHARETTVAYYSQANTSAPNVDNASGMS